jgi:hypothetical protein
VPPPPPNQIVYVKPAKPVEVKDTFEAYWITGRMHVDVRHNQLAARAAGMLSVRRLRTAGPSSAR